MAMHGIWNRCNDRRDVDWTMIRKSPPLGGCAATCRFLLAACPLQIYMEINSTVLYIERIVDFGGLLRRQPARLPRGSPIFARSDPWAFVRVRHRQRTGLSSGIGSSTRLRRDGAYWPEDETGRDDSAYHQTLTFVRHVPQS